MRVVGIKSREVVYMGTATYGWERCLEKLTLDQEALRKGLWLFATPVFDIGFVGRQRYPGLEGRLPRRHCLQIEQYLFAGDNAYNSCILISDIRRKALRISSVFWSKL